MNTSMKKSLFSLLGLALLSTSAAQTLERPRLIVGIVIDQMRYAYLLRFADDYGPDGFKRLERAGFNFKNVQLNYVPSFTGPGHASIYTGATPSVHGIVGNHYYSRALQRPVYCTDDASVHGVGTQGAEGRMSPKNLKATTITDELRLATRFRGKVIGLSLKDRAAILPAGHFANAAYWLDKKGRFISSSFYRPRLPRWVERFNRAKHYQQYIDQGWTLRKPKGDYRNSRADDNPFEVRLNRGKKPVFPYDLKAMETRRGPGIIKTTPYGNDLLRDFAEAAIENEKLGLDDDTDFLTLSFSSTDYVGHAFGPYSREIEDTYIRMDETLASLLHYLDEKVGKGRYLLFLTADHGVAPNPAYLKREGFEAGILKPSAFRKKLSQFSRRQYGLDLVKNYSNFNLFLDEDAMQQHGLNEDEVLKNFKRYMLEEPAIRRVYSEAEIEQPAGADYFKTMLFRGYDPKQNGQLLVLLRPGWLEMNEERGTTHGSPYIYDTHVPLLWYGWGIPKGSTTDRKLITQIAPTLSQLVHIPYPDGAQAKILKELMISRTPR